MLKKKKAVPKRGRRGKKKSGDRSRYATVTGPAVAVYREICDKLDELGTPIKRSSARNHLHRAMKKLAEGALRAAGKTHPSIKEINSLVENPAFQDAVGDVLQQIFIAGRWPSIKDSLVD